jgi:uncharacterized protein (TIGR03086 family)
MVDLEPATRTLTAVVAAVRDDQLTAPTPCTESSVGDLLDHVDGLCLAFTMAAQKTVVSGGVRSSADASRLADDWRTRIPDRLAQLAQAWADEKAWSGMTAAGGIDMPAEIAGVVALDEVIVHGWDIAVATGQDFECAPPLIEAAIEFVRGAVAQNPEGSPGLFGPPFPVSPDASLLDQLIGLTGRDPGWSAR